LACADKDYYDQGVAEHNIRPFVDDIAVYLGNWAAERRRWYSGRDDVRVLELGAGSCALSFLLSKEPWMAEIVAGDISPARCEQIRPHVQEMFGGDPAKVTFAELDFNEPLPFPDGHFDLVAMDGALHHSRAIWFTIGEIHRVLKPGGRFVAQREQFLAVLTYRLKLARLLETEEVQAGVSENAYFPAQYAYYLRAGGFDPEFKAVYPSWKFRFAAVLNGWIFAKYNIFAQRANEVARPAGLS